MRRLNKTNQIEFIRCFIFIRNVSQKDSNDDRIADLGLQNLWDTFCNDHDLPHREPEELLHDLNQKRYGH